MAWTEITRQQYRRDGLRYASDTTDAEWSLIEPLLPPASRSAVHAQQTCGGDQCDPLHCVDGLPVAAVAEGLSALLDGAGLFLRLARDGRFAIINHTWSWRRARWLGARRARRPG